MPMRSSAPRSSWQPLPSLCCAACSAVWRLPITCTANNTSKYAKKDRQKSVLFFWSIYEWNFSFIITFALSIELSIAFVFTEFIPFSCVLFFTSSTVSLKRCSFFLWRYCATSIVSLASFILTAPLTYPVFSAHDGSPLSLLLFFTQFGDKRFAHSIRVYSFL